MSDNQTCDALINPVHLRAGNNKTHGVFPSSYHIQSGESRGGEASPALGAMFAPMALDLPIRISSGSGWAQDVDGDSDSRTGSNVGEIAGGVVGGVVAIALIILAVIFWRRRQQRKKEEEQGDHTIEVHGIVPYSVPQYAPRIQRVQTVAGNENTAGFITKPGRRYSDTTVITRPQPASTPPASSTLGPSSSTPGTSNAGRPDIQNELEQLRREMEEMRELGFALPPDYRSEA
jgi:hypothetical protein